MLKCSCFTKMFPFPALPAYSEKEVRTGKKPMRKFILNSMPSLTTKMGKVCKSTACRENELKRGSLRDMVGPNLSSTRHRKKTKKGDIRISFPMSPSLLHPKWTDMDNYNKQFHIQMLISNPALEYSLITNTVK